MASGTSCCLCSFECYEFKSLYDDNGQTTEDYHVAVKYFDPSLLDAETEPTMRVICLECWQHIRDFHCFQQWILNAQSQQEDLKFIIIDEKKSCEEIPASDLTDLKSDSAIKNSIDSIMDAFDVLDDRNDDTCISKIEKKKVLNVKLKTIEQEVDEQTSIKSSKIDDNYFRCEACGASFSQYGNLRRHIRKKHAVQPLLKWICKYCNKIFKNRSNLERHKNKIHDCKKFSDNSESAAEEKVDDERNDMSTSDADDDTMSREKNIVTNNENHYFIAESLKSKETSYSTLFTINETSDNRNTELDVSVESSSNERNPNMQIHMPDLEIVDVKNEISTDVESDEDTNKVCNNFNSEMNSDMEEEYDEYLEKWRGDLECPKCKLHAQNYLQLSEHFMAKHPEERCYINCCQMTLHGQQGIAEHLQFHENPNAFECADCGKCFKNKRGLRSHKLQVHSDNRSMYHLHLCYCKRAQEQRAKGKQMEYDTLVCCQRKKKILDDDALIAKWIKELTCEICQDTFSYYSLMRTHFYHKHPGEKCSVLCCQRKMSRISDTLEHIRFHLDPHIYRCRVCNVDFSGKNTLAKHMRNAHDELLPKHRWACDECDKTFVIRQILTRHKNTYHSKQSPV